MQLAKKIGKEVEWWLREIRVAPKVLRHYGTRYPGRVQVPDTDIHIHIDPTDRRARKKVLFDLVRRRSNRNSRFWRDFVLHIDPTTALDIGANYGECVFSMEYPPNIRAIAVEANPELMPYLLGTLRDHPSAAQIEVKNCVVSDESGGAVPFYLNRESSGRSTALASVAADAGALEAVEVAALRIDDVLSQVGCSVDKLVFKIDVEGFEPKVLMGMSGSVAQASLAVGYVELDSHFLSRSGWTIERYDEEIISRFDLYVPVNNKSLVLKKYGSLNEYRRTFGEGRIHTDLILVKDPKRVDWLPPTWRLAA